MSVEPDQIKTWIEAGLPGAQATVEGDGQHFEAVVVSDEFAGLLPLARHRKVYAALGDRMKVEIHALSIKAYTNNEFANQNSNN